MPDRRHFITAGLLTLVIPNILCTVRAAQDDPADVPSSALSSPANDDGTRILVIGDSLSAEYGLPKGSGWVSQIARRLHDHGTGYQIHNSSISGDTTSGGISRLPTELKRYQPAVVIIELGSNDALRGLSLDMTRKNLAQMITWCQDSGARVILIGMQIPPNYGKRYADQFADMFPELASAYDTALVPFLFDGFAADQQMFQGDAIHPNEAGQKIMAQTVWKQLAPLLLELTTQ